MIQIPEISNSLKNYGYKLLEPIGEGGFSSVFKVQDFRYNQLFVCKITKISPDKDCSPKGNAKAQQYIDEVENLKLIWHPNVIKFYNHFIEGDHMFVILEYCSNGSVFDLLRKENQLSIRRIVTIVSQLAAAVEVCHSNNVAHHDIKPNNILIDEYNQIKLADFGMSTHLEGVSTKFMGSINVLAPEVINKSPYNPFSADIWSFGATILALVVSDWFLKGIPSHKAQLMVQSGEIQIPQETPAELIEIIKHSMIRDPEKRWTITQITNYLRESLGSILQVPNRACRILPRLSRTVAVPQNNRLSLPAFSIKACNSRKILSLNKLASLVPK